MSGVICLGDATTHGGNVKTASSTLFFNGINAALVGDLVSCPEHGTNAIIEGSLTTFDEGRAIVMSGCRCECGCRVISSRPGESIEA